MSIAEIRLESFDLALRTPIRTARATVSRRKGWLIGIVDETGRVGWGEAAPLQGWSGATFEGAGRALERLAAIGPGVSRLDAQTSMISEVAAGFDLALLDLEAQAVGRPLWTHLGGAEGSVPVNAILGGGRVDEVAMAATQAVGAGFSVLKCKVGMADDLDRIRGIAWSTGDRAKLRLDANRAWSPLEAEAVSVILSHEGINVEYLEDPVADLDTLALVKRDLPFPVAVDELVVGEADLARVVDEQLAEVLIIKPARVGGVTEAMRLARRAAAAGVDVVVSSTYDTPIGLTGWGSLAAALPGDRAHGLGTSWVFTEHVADPPRVSSGRLVLRSGIGLGVTPRSA